MKRPFPKVNKNSGTPTDIRDLGAFRERSRNEGAKLASGYTYICSIRSTWLGPARTDLRPQDGGNARARAETAFDEVYIERGREEVEGERQRFPGVPLMLAANQRMRLVWSDPRTRSSATSAIPGACNLEKSRFLVDWAFYVSLNYFFHTSYQKVLHDTCSGKGFSSRVPFHPRFARV